MKSLLRDALGLVCLLGAVVASAGDMLDSVNHVCVILDTSYSMQGYTDKKTSKYKPPTDPGRLAVLSTFLLHDLLKPETGKGPRRNDTFAVLPFQSNYAEWIGTGAPPSASVQPRRLAHIGLSAQQKAQARLQFIAKLSESSMPRTAVWTYYSPYIRKALDCIPEPHPEDREATTRTIVLITDGISDNPNGDLAYITTVLLEKLREQKTRLYVIFFGTEPKTLADGKQFFDDIYKADQNNSYRAFPEPAFPVTRGQELPATMVRLFSKAFGYVHEPADDHKRNVESALFDLAKSYKPGRAVVVALRLDPTGNQPPAPTQDIVASGGEGVDDDHALSATERGGSYSAVWVEQPRPAMHTVSITNGQADSVFVLRPTRLLVDMRDFLPLSGYPERRSCFDKDAIKSALAKKQERFETMADTECWIDFLVQSPAGDVSVLPDHLKVTFRIKEDQGGGNPLAIGNEDGQAIPSVNHRPDPDTKGQRFYDRTNFEDNRPAGSPPRKFDALVTASVAREDANVGGRGDDEPFRVTVYPRVEVAPDPTYRVIPDAGSPLEKQASGETLFNLKEVGDWIVDGVQVDKPNPSNDLHVYTVHAFLTTLDAQGNPQDNPPKELKGASFTLDGKSICFKASNVNAQCDWGKGVDLKRHELVCRGTRCTLSQTLVHRFSVTTGNHDSGDPHSPPKVYVNFSLRQPPYDHFDVIRPLEVTIYVAEHRFNLWSLLPFLLLLLGLLAALMLLRPRFALPKDLGYGLATMADPHRFQAKRLPSASPWKLLFSRKAERVVTDRDGELLGWIRPEDDELYGLRPASGVEVVDSQGAVLEPESGVALLRVHQAYRLRRSNGELMFRMEYL